MALSYREPTTQADAARAWAVDLRDALLTCDRLDAAMVRLVYTDGFTYGRVAEHLAVPLSRVESGIARGLQCIGDALTGSPRR